MTTLYVQPYYPGNPNRGAALLASYVWEHEADYWLGMTDEECKMKVGIRMFTNFSSRRFLLGLLLVESVYYH